MLLRTTLYLVSVVDRFRDRKFYQHNVHFYQKYNKYFFSMIYTIKFAETEAKETSEIFHFSVLADTIEVSISFVKMDLGIFPIQGRIPLSQILLNLLLYFNCFQFCANFRYREVPHSNTIPLWSQ